MDMKSVRKEHGPMERMLSMVGRKGALKVDGYHIGPDKVKAYEDYLIKWHRDPPKFKPQTEKRDREDAKGESSPEGKRGPHGHQSFKLLRGKLEDWMPKKEAEEALQSNKQAAWETNYKD